MALIDDPKAWILRLFELEEREGRGADCIRYPEGTRPAGLSLDAGEQVFGIYKGKYYFTAKALIIVDGGGRERIPWADVRACSSQHGEGKTFSNLTMADGGTVRVRIGDMAKDWSGRISQLFHQMIERYGQRASMGRPLVPVQEFFAEANDDYSIAPNLEPHPPLEFFHGALCELEQSDDGTRVLMHLVSEDEEFVSDAIVVVTTRPKDQLDRLAEYLHSDGVVVADETIIRLVGAIPDGANVWHITWD